MSESSVLSLHVVFSFFFPSSCSAQALSVLQDEEIILLSLLVNNIFTKNTVVLSCTFLPKRCLLLLLPKNRTLYFFPCAFFPRDFGHWSYQWSSGWRGHQKDYSGITNSCSKIGGCNPKGCTALPGYATSSQERESTGELNEMPLSKNLYICVMGLLLILKARNQNWKWRAGHSAYHQLILRSHFGSFCTRAGDLEPDSMNLYELQR